MALGGCSLFTSDVTDCQSTTQCRDQFGIGFVCAPDGFCEEAPQLSRCMNTFPPDLFQHRELYQDTLVIGTLFDRSAATHVARERSARLALRQANDEGGLANRDFAAVFCTIEKNDQFDDLEREQAAERAAEYLATVLEVPAIIGPAASKDTQAVFNRLNEVAPGKTLVISPSATAVTLTALDPIDVSDRNPGLLWRTAPLDSEQGQAIAVDMTKPGAGRDPAAEVRNVIVIHEQGVYGDELSNVFIREFEQLAPGAKTDPYTYTSTDQLIELTTDASASDADEVLFISSQWREVVAFLTAVDSTWRVGQAGFSSKRIFLTDGAANDDVVTHAPSGPFANLRGSRPAPADADRNLVFRNFRAQYAAEYSNEDVSKYSFTANAYDAAWLVLYGVAWAHFQHDGDITAVNIARGLRRISSGQRVEIGASAWSTVLQQFRAGQSIDVAGTSGDLDYDPLSEETSSDVEIWKIANKTIVGVDIWSPSESAVR